MQVVYNICMSLLLPILIFLNIGTGLLAVYFSYKDEKHKKESEKQKIELTRRYYEARVLNEISSKIGYELNIQNFADTFVLSVENLITLSTISYALIDNDKISLKTYEKEPVGEKYYGQVKNIILENIKKMGDGTREYQIATDSNVRLPSKSYITLHYDILPLSYFSIPLLVNKKFVGLITITSRMKDIYLQEDIDLLSRVVTVGQNTLSSLEEIIQTEKSKLSSLVASHPSGSILFTIEGNDYKLEAINTAAKDFLKLASVQDKLSVVQGFGNSLPINQYIWDTVHEQKSIFLKDASVNERFFKIYINPVYNKTTAAIYGVCLFMQDVTIEKEMEEVRESFTNMVVHELRSPLTAIKGASSLLLSGKIKDADKEKMLTLIKDSSEKMLNQIGDLLDAAKIEAGKFSIIQVSSDLNMLIHERIDAFLVLANAKNIQIILKLYDKMPKFQFDKTRVDQVITNLLSNSIKFTPENGSIEVDTMVEGNFAKVTIKDTGIGIPEKKKALLFSEYAQVQSVFRKDGTGLGLFISRGIVESHGGKIWIERSIEAGSGESGTVISFTLPVLQAVQQLPTVSPMTGKMVN